jgi:hypothetical protein
MLSGNRLNGSYANYTIADLSKDIDEFCDNRGFRSDFIAAWAQSILLPPSYHADLGNMVEHKMPALGFSLHSYQRREAEWFASRKGGVAALSCGTGKSVTAWAAAKAAVRNGMCNDSRCTVICPVNAAGQWGPYLQDLAKDYKTVELISVDSTHKFVGSGNLGGALIVDEAHKVKCTTSRRTHNTFAIRLGYEWCMALTGTLLHTGPEGVLAVQDLAIPGLSRFLDKWKFGQAFDCIIQKKVGTRTRPILTLPAAGRQGALATYLNRGVRSLSFNSPEVQQDQVVPGQTKLLQDTWPCPDWVRELQTRKDPKTPPEHRSVFYWLPECEWRWALGVSSVAIHHELMELHAMGLDCDRDPLPERLLLPGENDTPEFPHFTKVRAEATREGRLDRCIEAYRTDEGLTSYRWRYAPGSDMLCPKP